jgi:hypothetical protein
MEVAATGRPDAAPSAAGRALSALEAGEAIEALSLEAVDLGPALAKLGKFELVAADEGVGENPPIAILRASDGIAVKDNARPFRCERAHGGGGVLGAALDRSAGLHVLRGVDADQAHVGEVARRQPDPQRVAIDGVGDDGVHGGLVAAFGGSVHLPAPNAGHSGKAQENAGKLHNAILTPSPTTTLAALQKGGSGVLRMSFCFSHGVIGTSHAN